ncbi:MAG TPA: hypothetical protein VMW91_08280 [Desulfosporosinus sp.]|nr:hypothetical protein [Desulfosporosinus sp.]
MEASSIPYKDPFALSVFGVIFILIGFGMLLHRRRKMKGLLADDPFLKVFFRNFDPILIILLGIAFIFIAIGFLETQAAILAVLIILYKVVF